MSRQWRLGVALAPRPYFASLYVQSGGSLWSTRSGSSCRCTCPTSKICSDRSADHQRNVAWRHRPWVTVFATPGSSSTRPAISKAAIVAVARTPTTTPVAHANGRRPRAITAATISSTSSRTISTSLKYGGKHDGLAPCRQPAPQRTADTVGIQCQPGSAAMSRASRSRPASNSS